MVEFVITWEILRFYQDCKMNQNRYISTLDAESL